MEEGEKNRTDKFQLWSDSIRDFKKSRAYSNRTEVIPNLTAFVHRLLSLLWHHHPEASARLGLPTDFFLNKKDKLLQQWEREGPYAAKPLRDAQNLLATLKNWARPVRKCQSDVELEPHLASLVDILSKHHAPQLDRLRRNAKQLQWPAAAASSSSSAAAFPDRGLEGEEEDNDSRRVPKRPRGGESTVAATSTGSGCQAAPLPPTLSAKGNLFSIPGPVLAEMREDHQSTFNDLACSSSDFVWEYITSWSPQLQRVVSRLRQQGSLGEVHGLTKAQAEEVVTKFYIERGGLNGMVVPYLFRLSPQGVVLTRWSHSKTKATSLLIEYHQSETKPWAINFTTSKGGRPMYFDGLLSESFSILLNRSLKRTIYHIPRADVVASLETCSSMKAVAVDLTRTTPPRPLVEEQSSQGSLRCPESSILESNVMLL